MRYLRVLLSLSFVLFTFSFLLLLGLPQCVWAQEASTNHNVILRRDPSTSSPPLEHLAIGARLTLIDATTTSGFYHVRTEDDQVGWVYANFVTLSLAPPPAPAPTTGPQCDSSISAHVYHPNRLLVKQECIEVTGTIVDATANQSKHQADGTRHEKDGDTHGWLKLDAGFENLLNAGNMSDESGNLVFEIVCKYPINSTAPDAKVACQSYTDNVTLPPVGSHVRIVGRYVQDTFHKKWMEIHPVTSITVVP
jgi:hypothetical protein